MSVKIKIDKKDLEVFAKNMLKAPIKTTKLLEKTVAATQFTLQKHTIKDNPVPYITGFLLASFRYQQPIKGSSNKLMARWFPTVKYAARVDNPKYNKSGSANYMKRIEKKARPDIDKLFKKAAEKMSATITKI